jgi:hypothetical protein
MGFGARDPWGRAFVASPQEAKWLHFASSYMFLWSWLTHCISMMKLFLEVLDYCNDVVPLVPSFTGRHLFKARQYVNET